jgi:hypothetical protein
MQANKKTNSQYCQILMQKGPFLHQQNTNNSSLMQNFANSIKRDVFEVKIACHTRGKTRNSSEETNVECL